MNNSKIKYRLIFSMIVIVIILIVMSMLLITKVFHTQGNKNVNKLNIDLTFEKQFGSPNDSENDLIGLISAFHVNQKQQLFLIDDAFKHVKKYSKDGKLLSVLGYGPGKGPGEFNGPNGLSSDSLGNIYVIDKINLTITIINDQNEVIKTKSLKFIPAQIMCIKPMVVDVLGFPSFYKGNIVHRFNLEENSEDSVFTYFPRMKGKEAELGYMSGNSGRLVKDREKNIYVSNFFPYQITKYSNDGKKIFDIKSPRDIPIPILEIKSNHIKTSAGIRGLSILNDKNIIIVLYTENSESSTKQLFDFFNSKDGSYIGSISCNMLGLEKVRFINTDLMGNIYFDFLDPYPHIKKFSIKIKHLSN